jgi:hypothetical protein
MIQAITEEAAAAINAKAAGVAAPKTADLTAGEPEPAPNTIEALKAARKGAVAPEPKEVKPPAEKPAKAVKTAEVDIDDRSLAKFTKLNTELTEARRKLRELEPSAASAAKVAKATDLIAKGKPFDAIRDLVGLDAFNAAVREVVGAGDGKPVVTEEQKALQAKLDALEKDNAETKAQLSASAAAQRELGVTKIIDEVTGLKDQFPYLSRSGDWVREALKGADSAYEQAKALSMAEKGRDLNDAEKNNLLRAALEVAEEDRAKLAKLYGAPETEKEPPAKKSAPRTIDRSMRGNVTTILPKKKNATIEELKRERRARS